MRARFSILALVALVALATGALGIAVTLATTDSARWPTWLRPYHHHGWWAVLALLLAAAVLSVWQYTHQARDSLANQPTTSVQTDDSGPAAGQDVTITGQGPTAGRDILGVIGGQSPTAGRDLYIGVGGSGPPAATSSSDVRWPTPDQPVSNLGARNPAFTGRQELLVSLARDLKAGGTAAVVQATAIHGLGGIGKTQLVLEYAHRHTGDYDLICGSPPTSPLLSPASCSPWPAGSASLRRPSRPRRSRCCWTSYAAMAAGC
jgi:hypothetical protein